MTAAAPAPAPTPTPLKIGNEGVIQAPDQTYGAVDTILREAYEWGMLGIDLEWNKDGRITWVGLGHAKGGTGRAISLWWPTLPEDVRALIAYAFADPLLPKLGQNGIQADKPIWEREVGPTGGVWEDTMLMHHAAFPGVAHDLQQIVSQFLVVPPWKAWRREANRQAAEARKSQEKVERKEARVLAHTTANAEKKRVAEEAKALKAAEKKRLHDERNAAAAAQKELKAAEKKRIHEEKNAATAAAAAARKTRKQAMAGGAPAPAAPPAAPAPAAAPPTLTLVPPDAAFYDIGDDAPPAGAVVPMTVEPSRPERDDEIPFDMLPEMGLVCPLPGCGTEQRLSPSGAICANGHGGVDGIEPAPLPPPVVVAPSPPPEPPAAPRALLRAPARPGRFAAASPPSASPSLAPAPPPGPPPPAAAPAAPTPPAPLPPRPNGGSLFPGRVAGAVMKPKRKLTVIVADADGVEREIEVEPEESV